MSNWSVQGLNAALALGCLGLAALIYDTIVSPPTAEILGTEQGLAETGEPGLSEQLSPPADSSPALALPPLSVFQEISRRPLFTETRRPAIRAAAPQVQAAPELDLLLTGVVTADSGAIAFLRLKGRPPIVRATAGQTVQGWRVDQILPDRIVLSHGESRRELRVGKAPGPAK